MIPPRKGPPNLVSGLPASHNHPPGTQFETRNCLLRNADPRLGEEVRIPGPKKDQKSPAPSHSPPFPSVPGA
ncbi:hypothetical protein LZ31DRAFT_557743 [Colletotrichum somersetense]|nr:hypothetical protein LZ31DRAFT_557743 [Colletotrichum somersetense]